MDQQIEQAKADRQELMDDIDDYIETYEGRLPGKSFPWEGCSNIQVPLTQTSVETIYSRIINAIFNVEPFWMVRPVSDSLDAYDKSKSLERFLQYVSVHVLDMYSVCQNWFLDSIKYGTGVIEVCWERKHQYRYKRHLDEVIKERKLIYNGPKVKSIALDDFYLPAGVDCIANSPWVGKGFYLTWPELKMMEEEGEYRNVDKIRDHYEATLQDRDERRAEEAGLDVSLFHHVYRLHEIHFMWDFDNDGTFVPVTMVYHPGTMQPLKIDYFAYDHCRWPFMEFRYMPRERFFYGIGVPQMLHYLQSGIDTMVNQLIDGSTLSNVPFFKAKRGSLPRNIKFRPGFIFHTDEPDRDLIVERAGQPYPDLFLNARALQDWGEKRVGISDYLMGRESPAVGTKATATSTLALLQESSRRFDLVLRDVRHASTELGYQILELYQQYTKQPMNYMFNRNEVSDVLEEYARTGQWKPQAQSINLTGDDLRDRFSIELSASRSSLNREMEKQNYLALFQLSMGYYKQMLELAAQLGNPQIPQEYREAITRVADASKELARRVYDSFDVRDPSALIPEIGEFINEFNRSAAQFAGPAGNMGPNQTPPPGPPGQPQQGAPQQVPPQGGPTERGVLDQILRAQGS